MLRCRERGRGGGGIYTPPAAPKAPAADSPRARILARFAGPRLLFRITHPRQRCRGDYRAASASSGARAGAGLPRARILARFAGLRSAAGCRAAAGAARPCESAAATAAAAADIWAVFCRAACAIRPRPQKTAKNRPEDWKNPGGGISLTLGRGPFSVVFDDNGAKTHQIRLREALVSMQNVFFTLAGFGQNAKRLLLLKMQRLRVAAAKKAAAAAPLTLNNVTHARVYINPLY